MKGPKRKKNWTGQCTYGWGAVRIRVNALRGRVQFSAVRVRNIYGPSTLTLLNRPL